MSPKLENFHPPARAMDYTPYIEGIQKTGFPLEFKVARELRNRKWTVITNRYYLDNDEERPREMDIVAYRFCNKHSDFDLFTAVILSCKKSDHSVWGFLTRSAPTRDPNMDREPFHHYSSSPALDYAIANDKEWAKTYHQKMLSHNIKEIFHNGKDEIFALQELSNGAGERNKSLGKPLGDSSIFSSVISLMKAQYYELSVRHRRERKKPAIYQCNLLSVVDGEMIEFKFSDKAEVTAKHVLYENYIARYIFNEKETFARVVFTTFDNLNNALDQYERLHSSNQKFFKTVIDDFYEGIVKDSRRRAVFEKEFYAHLSRKLRILYLKEHRHYDKLNVSGLWFNVKKDVLEISIDDAATELNFLNNKAIEIGKQAARLFFKYEGEVIYDDSFPF
jgi:hypothetical protein